MSSYCGLFDAKIRASDKYLPVPKYESAFRNNFKPLHTAHDKGPESVLNEKVEE